MLNDRKRLVLKAVVDGYVRTSEPVGSKSIVDHCNLQVSSATVRNILADLERSGYLLQPHVSAGRVPSDKGYRVYVDKLMTPVLLSLADRTQVEQALAEELPEPVALLRRAAKLLSDLTGYTAIAFIAGLPDLRLKALRLFPVETGEILLLLIPEEGPVSHSLAGLGMPVPSRELAVAAEAFCRAFSGRPSGAIKAEEIAALFLNQLRSQHMAELLSKLVYQLIQESKQAVALVEGLSNLFKLQDLNHPDESAAVANLVENKKDYLLAQLEKTAATEAVTIRIGEELEPDVLRNCSFVTATYHGMVGRGSLGIVGPKRMPYGRVSGSLGYIREALNSRLQVDLT